MELKSLLLGLALSIGVFAVKCGAGLSYLVASKPKKRVLILALGLFLFSYLLLFVSSWFLVQKLQLLNHLETVLQVAKSGMIIHIVFAIALLIWGTALLGQKKVKSNESDLAPQNRSWAWLLLVLPCPVCFSAIFCSVAFFTVLFPENILTLLGLCAAFFLVSLSTTIILSFIAGAFNAEQLLGRIMVFIALYFFLTISIVPQFGEIDRIYRLSLNRAEIPNDYPAGSTFFIIFFLAVSFVAGALKRKRITP